MASHFILFPGVIWPKGASAGYQEGGLELTKDMLVVQENLVGCICQLIAIYSNTKVFFAVGDGQVVEW